MPDSDLLDTDFDLGRTALLEITPAGSIGAPAGSVDEGDGVTTVHFETLLAGYPGWRWTVSIAHVADQPASVLETELTPGDSALLSPAWVPWVDRLADYSTAQDTAIEDDESNDEIDQDDDFDEDDDDSPDEDEDDDDLSHDVLHSGDLDGVDIDDLDDTAEDTADDTDDDPGDDDDDDTGDDGRDEHERSP